MVHRLFSFIALEELSREVFHKTMRVCGFRGYTQRVSEKPEPHMPAHNPSSRLARLLPTTRSLPMVAGLAAVYFFACKRGLKLAVVHPSATAVWPGTGIALAALLLFGYAVWPGVFLGAFAVNLATAGSIVSSVGIASGNTLEALVGAYLITKFANGLKVFDRAEDIFKFFLLTCALATTIAASVGTASLFLTGFSRGAQPGPFWLAWWLGDMAGAVLVTPCFLLWSSKTTALRSKRSIVLQGAAFVSLLLVGVIVFSDFLFSNAQDHPLKFLCIPFVVWVAFEMSPRAAALTILVFAAVAVGSALHSARGASIPNESLLVTQVFFSVVALTSLLVSATVMERDKHEQTLEKAKIELEEKVFERTQQLEGLSARLLQAHDQERRKIARELHDSTGQSLAVLTMNLSACSKTAEKVSPELAGKLAENQKIVRAVSDELRTTSYLLHPPLLDEMGLQAGLRSYIKGFKERSNIDVSLNLFENLDRLPPELELMIFRVVQECLTNIHRHSGSSTATISLSNSMGRLNLQIRDRGKGMSPEKLAAVAGPGTAGVGLRGMRERVKAFGGEFEILSDGKGTLVRAVIPLRASSPATEA
jgi:signal transduction histidine kinase